MKSLWKLKFSIVSVSISFLLIEIALRIIPIQFSPISEVEEKLKNTVYVNPPLNSKIGNFRYRTTAPTPNNFRKDTIRILFLGDSFTWGDGVAEENRFTDLLSQNINRQLKEQKSTINLHIFNAGKNGTEPTNWNNFFAELNPLYNPHVVFAVFFLRDGTRLSTSLKCNKDLIENIKERYPAYKISRISYLARIILDKLAWRDFSRIFIEKIKCSYLGSPDEQAEWIIQQQALLKIAERCQNTGKSFHLIIFPLLFNLKNYEFDDVEEEIKKFAKINQIPIHSLTSGFKGQEADLLWVSKFDQHPNERGHQIAAETLTPYVQNVVKEIITKQWK